MRHTLSFIAAAAALTLTGTAQAGTVVLAADNVTRRKINDQIRAELQKKGELPEGKTFKLEDRSGRGVERGQVPGERDGHFATGRHGNGFGGLAHGL